VRTGLQAGGCVGRMQGTSMWALRCMGVGGLQCGARNRSGCLARSLPKPVGSIQDVYSDATKVTDGSMHN
jgi:hypothetical protein